MNFYVLGQVENLTLNEEKDITEISPDNASAVIAIVAAVVIFLANSFVAGNVIVAGNVSVGGNVALAANVGGVANVLTGFEEDPRPPGGGVS